MLDSKTVRHQKKNIKYWLIIALGVQLVLSCSKEFLDVDPRATQVETNYYKNAAEAFNGIIAAYDPLGWEGAGSYGNFIGLNIASDDHVSGGGSSTDVN